MKVDEPVSLTICPTSLLLKRPHRPYDDPSPFPTNSTLFTMTFSSNTQPQLVQLAMTRRETAAAYIDSPPPTPRSYTSFPQFGHITILNSDEEWNGGKGNYFVQMKRRNRAFL